VPPGENLERGTSLLLRAGAARVIANADELEGLLP
jgi:hypothetical protein